MKCGHNSPPWPDMKCDRYEAYCNCGDFIREHIFPGGHLPCVGAIVDACKVWKLPQPPS